MDELNKEVEKVLQEKRTEYYRFIEGKISEDIKMIPASIVIGLVLGGIALLFNVSDTISLGLVVVISVLGAVVFSCDILKRKKQEKMLYTDFEKMESLILQEKSADEKLAEKLEELNRRQEELKKQQEKYAHPVCPMCGGTNTKRISTTNRAVSIAVIGLASSKIGKQYECFTCKHKW